MWQIRHLFFAGGSLDLPNLKFFSLKNDYQCVSS